MHTIRYSECIARCNEITFGGSSGTNIHAFKPTCTYSVPFTLVHSFEQKYVLYAISEKNAILLEIVPVIFSHSCVEIFVFETAGSDGFDVVNTLRVLLR
jgi:hypothetical protein